MSITTEYRGYSIRYDENKDSWGCYECGVDEPSLSKAKAQIDAMHLKLRKKAALPCYEFNHPSVNDQREGRFELTEAKIIDYLGERWQRRGWSDKPDHFEGHRVAAVAQRSGRDRAARREVLLHHLVADTSRTIELAEEANRLLDEARAAWRRYQDAVDALPRVQIEDIADLVVASSARLTEEPRP